MAKDSSIAKLKKRAEKALKKMPADRTYREIKDLSNWIAVQERWEAMKGNRYASGLMRTEKTRQTMRSAQRLRRKKELTERIRKATQKKMRRSSSDD